MSLPMRLARSLRAPLPKRTRPSRGRRSPSRQLPEAWLALAIVAGTGLLFLVAYWRRGSDEAYA